MCMNMREYEWICVNVCECVRLRMNPLGNAWVYVDVCECVRGCMAAYEYVEICMNVYGYV